MWVHCELYLAKITRNYCTKINNFLPEIIIGILKIRCHIKGVELLVLLVPLVCLSNDQSRSYSMINISLHKFIICGDNSFLIIIKSK